MTDIEFKSYVAEEKRKGLSESQIARKLGMSLTRFMGQVNRMEKAEKEPNEVIETKDTIKMEVENTPKPAKTTKKATKKSERKPASGAAQPTEEPNNI